MINVVTAKWSIDEYHRMQASGILNERRVELLSGNIIEMSPEGILHTVCNEALANYLRQLLTQRAWIREAHPITLSDSEPEPDIAIVKLPWSEYSKHHPYAQDIFWLIEISDSTLDKDLTAKQKIYGEAGIAEYWVLDLKNIKVIVFREPNPTGYSHKREYNQGIIKPLAFPDLEIPLAKIFSAQIFD